MTEHEAKKVVAYIAAMFPTPAWDVETLNGWADELRDLDYEKANIAARTWVRTRPDRPSVAALRRAVLDANLQTARAAHLAPEEAWGFVMQCFRDIGGYASFPNRHPLVARVVQMMGWQALCQSENQVADRARFLEFYRSQLEADIRHAAARPGALPAPRHSPMFPEIKPGTPIVSDEGGVRVDALVASVGKTPLRGPQDA